jgi:hypothetical protein
METLPYELQAEILCADFETWLSAIEGGFGKFSLHSYIQKYAKSKFITIKYKKDCIKYFVNNKLHKINSPAIECSNGDKYWYING